MCVTQATMPTTEPNPNLVLVITSATTEKAELKREIKVLENELVAHSAAAHRAVLNSDERYTLGLKIDKLVKQISRAEDEIRAINTHLQQVRMAAMNSLSSERTLDILPSHRLRNDPLEVESESDTFVTMGHSFC
eukprot:TRINITY_DN14_c1_g2_i1.p1 TRINITY_DN14_c1_g2~~TRINITY_DN14_c1_g2_i1.p1  ORF type:complete len:135 (+),score=23.46 TRINITY_DN14_c1_g2_i1:33-437(+)